MLSIKSYLAQKDSFPASGRHIMGHYNEESIVVYQAYTPSIGNFAVKHGYLVGSEYNLNRMSWIKTNFLWMMQRSQWGTNPNQEMILALWIKRSAFDYLLAEAVYSSFAPAVYETYEAWRAALLASPVRLQWDPDYTPLGERLERRAIQIGLSKEVLQQYAQGGWIVRIEDMTPFVNTQKVNAHPERLEHLQMPHERVYPVTAAEMMQKLQLSPST